MELHEAVRGRFPPNVTRSRFVNFDPAIIFASEEPDGDIVAILTIQPPLLSARNDPLRLSQSVVQNKIIINIVVSPVGGVLLSFVVVVAATGPRDRGRCGGVAITSVRNIKKKNPSQSDTKLNMRSRRDSEKRRPVVQSATCAAPLWRNRVTTTTKTTRKEYGFFVNMPVTMQTFSSLIYGLLSSRFDASKSVSGARVVGGKTEKLSSLTSYV